MARFTGNLQYGLRTVGLPVVVTSKAGVTQAWAGIATVNSNTATSVVSTSLVASDSIIQLTAMCVTAQASGFCRSPSISSINPGVAFVISSPDAQPFNANSTTSIYWELKGSH